MKPLSLSPSLISGINPSFCVPGAPPAPNTHTQKGLLDTLSEPNLRVEKLCGIPPLLQAAMMAEDAPLSLAVSLGSPRGEVLTLILPLWALPRACAAGQWPGQLVNAQC